MRSGRVALAAVAALSLIAAAAPRSERPLRQPPVERRTPPVPATPEQKAERPAPGGVSVPATETALDSLSGMTAECPDFRTGLGLAVRAQHLLANGTIASDWNPANSGLCLGATEGVSSAAVTDGSGGALVIWVDERREEGDLYAQHFRSDRTLAQGWTIDGVPVCTALGSQYRVAVTSDSAGGMIAVWQDFRSGKAGDIYAQRVTASGEVAWTAGGVPVCVDSTDQAAPSVVADGAGGALIAWQDRRSGDPAIYFQHLSSAGMALLDSGGVRVGQPSSPRLNPVLLSDRTGGTYLCWQEQEAGRMGLRLTRISGTAQPVAGWQSAGVALTDSAQDADAPALCSAGAAGVFISWCDRGSTWARIRAQRIGQDGSLAWSAGGVVVCGVPGEHSAPALIADGAGGAIIGWDDYRASLRSDLYAQRLSSSGELQWASGGVPLCVAPGDQHSVALASDGAGGAICTWSDSRAAAGRFFPARMIYGGPIPRLETLKADPSRVRITWRTSTQETRTFSVVRQSGGAGEWKTMAGVRPDAEGSLMFKDEEVSPGDHFVYRLTFRVQGSDIVLSQVAADIPQPKPLALHFARWDKSSRTVRLSVTLGTKEPARIELFDVMGRREISQDLGSPGPGDYDFQLQNSSSLSSGVYFLRLTQGRLQRTGKTVVLR